MTQKQLPAALVVGGFVALVGYILVVGNASYLKGCDAAMRYQDEDTLPEIRKAICERIQDTYK